MVKWYWKFTIGNIYGYVKKKNETAHVIKRGKYLAKGVPIPMARKPIGVRKKHEIENAKKIIYFYTILSRCFGKDRCWHGKFHVKMKVKHEYFKARFQLVCQWGWCMKDIWSPMPTTVFLKISVRRNKNYLESSIAGGRLKISRWPFHSCAIFEAFLRNSLRSSKV